MGMADKAHFNYSEDLPEFAQGVEFDLVGGFSDTDLTDIGAALLPWAASRINTENDVVLESIIKTSQDVVYIR